jgi:hypothetical protein
MKVTMGNKWAVKLKGRIEEYDFEVGILENKQYKEPVVEGLFDNNLGTFAKGPVRKTSPRNTDKKVGEILVDNMKRLNIDLLRAPFKKKSSEIMQFTKAFLSLVTYKPTMNLKRVENLLQAVVRNPIYRQDYGINSGYTAKAKGFNRHLFDTGQMFKNIRVKAKKRV